jgi:hypothetical protein
MDMYMWSDKCQRKLQSVNRGLHTLLEARFDSMSNLHNITFEETIKKSLDLFGFDQR